MTLPAPHGLDIYIGDDYEKKVRIRSGSITGPYVNLTGWTARAQLRSLAGAVLATFVVVVHADQTANTGLITMSLTKTTTAALAPGTGVYDLEVTRADTKVKTFIAGTVTITNDVTRT